MPFPPGKLKPPINSRQGSRFWRAVTFLALLTAEVPAIAAPMDLCAGGARVTCVVDGDTAWIDGEKIRLADIDAPEVNAPCVEARILAARSAGQLAELLEAEKYLIERNGQDKYGRTLAIITIGGRSVGDVLVEERLARSWSGKRETWCQLDTKRPTAKSHDPIKCGSRCV